MLSSLLVLLLKLTSVAEVGLSLLFVCLFVSAISQTDAAQITKFDMQIIHDEF